MVTTDIYTLSLHDALPISTVEDMITSGTSNRAAIAAKFTLPPRSEEHTSELQSRFDLVCRLLLEKKKLAMCRTIGVVILLKTAVNKRMTTSGHNWTPNRTS